MKHRHVLVQRELEPCGRGAVEQLKNLADVEIVRNRQVIQTRVFHQQFRGDRVGNIEREVADLFQVRTVLVVVQRAEIAKQQAIGFGVFNELEVARFTRLEDARRGEDHFSFLISAFCFAKRDRLLVAARIFEVTVNCLHSAFERRADLRKSAAEDA